MALLVACTELAVRVPTAAAVNADTRASIAAVPRVNRRRAYCVGIALQRCAPQITQSHGNADHAFARAR